MSKKAKEFTLHTDRSSSTRRQLGRAPEGKLRRRQPDRAD